jgi:hypothetical protein
MRQTSIVSRDLRRQGMRGQAVVLAFAALIFLTLMVLAAFNISQVTHAKSQLMNAADAGAYMFANTLARDLNFMAYTNRAIVANHVVVGQLTTLWSLADLQENMAGTSTGKVSAGQSTLKQIIASSKLTVIHKHAQTLLDGAEDWDQRLDENWINAGFAEAISKQDRFIGELWRIQNDGIANSLQADVEKIRTVILDNVRNDNFEWQIVAQGELVDSAYAGQQAASQLAGFTMMKPRSSNFRTMVNESRDEFTKRRIWLDGTAHGYTELGRDLKTWSAVDTFNPDSASGLWSGRNTSFYTWLQSSVLVPGGDSGSGEKTRRDVDPDYDGGTPRQARVNEYIDTVGENADYEGLRTWRELSDRERTPEPFVVLVRKPIDDDDTPGANATFRLAADRENPRALRLEDSCRYLYAAAAAEAYFSRPTHNESDPTKGSLLPTSSQYPNGVYPNLFSPYWQTRLVELPAQAHAVLAKTSCRG